MKYFTIEECLPGQVVVKDGIRYIVVEDIPNNHVEGYLLNCRTGSLLHWSRVFKFDEIVVFGR